MMEQPFFGRYDGKAEDEGEIGIKMEVCKMRVREGSGL